MPGHLEAGQLPSATSGTAPGQGSGAGGTSSLPLSSSTEQLAGAATHGAKGQGQRGHATFPPFLTRQCASLQLLSSPSLGKCRGTVAWPGTGRWAGGQPAWQPPFFWSTQLLSWPKQGAALPSRFYYRRVLSQMSMPSHASLSGPLPTPGATNTKAGPALALILTLHGI